MFVRPASHADLCFFVFFFLKKKIVDSKVRTVTWQAHNHTKHLILLFGQLNRTLNSFKIRFNFNK